ncbi:permease [bacterium SCSIO 12741]|nr:permease [bacterium SCSIO 12741]
MNWIGRYFTEWWHIFMELAPFLLLGLLFAGILKVFVPTQKIKQWVGKSGFSSSLKAALIGIPLPLCSCGVIPTGISFRQQGASKGATVSFLISTPQTGIDSLILTYTMLNPAWAITRPLAAFFSGVFSGWWVDSQKKIESDSLEMNVEEEKPSRSIKRLLSYAFLEFLPDISRTLLAGIFLAAAITLFVPDSLFSEAWNDPWLHLIVMLLASVPLYVCATGSIPIGAALLLKGISPGAVFVFLMAGPATNLATLTVLWKSLGKKLTLQYLLSIVFFALATGVLIDYFLPSEWFTNLLFAPHSHGAHILPVWLHQFSAGLLLITLFYTEYQKLAIRRPMNDKELPESKVFIVEGMSCNHCVANVENAVKQLSGVDSVEADFRQNRLQVSGNVDENEVQKKVESVGYLFKGLRKN